MHRRARLALVLVAIVAASTGFAPGAHAADDGFLYRITTGLTTCATTNSVQLLSTSQVQVSYPAGASLTVEYDDTGTGTSYQAPIAVALNPAGNVGTENFFGIGVPVTLPATVLFRMTLLIGGNPTYQQIVSVECPNGNLAADEPGIFSVVSENLFPTADPVLPPADTAVAPAAVVAQPTTTG